MKIKAIGHLVKTNPKRTQYEPNLHFTAENTEYAEKKDISVSDCSIERYALYAISPCSGLGHPVDLRTRRLMKNKANSKPISEKAKMNANFYSTKDYENEPRLRAPGKQTQSKPIAGLWPETRSTKP